MSRHDSNFTAAGAGEMDAGELLKAMDAAGGSPGDRFAVMAQYLSGASGWREAKAALGGTFNDPVGVARLTPRKD